MSAKTPFYSAHHSPTGTQGLWHRPGVQLPAYIQNVVKGIMKSGKSREAAIPIAIGRIKGWASGEGNVHPEVRAAAAKAIAEWNALKSKGKKSMSAEQPQGRVELGIFNSLLHPRILKGLGGGQFTSGAGSGKTKKTTTAKKKKKPVVKKAAAKKSSSSSSSSSKSTTAAKKTTTTTATKTTTKPVVPGPVAPIAKPGQVQKYKTKKLSNIQSRYDLRQAAEAVRVDLSNPRVPSDQKREIVSGLIHHGRLLDGVPIVYEVLGDFLEGE
jgi:hypothetical protein